jgi:hypothetical protein
MGRLLMPRSGGAIHPAMRAGSTTRCIRLFTKTRSSPEGSHSSFLRTNSSAGMMLPVRSHDTPDQTPMVRLKRDEGSASRSASRSAEPLRSVSEMRKIRPRRQQIGVERLGVVRHVALAVGRSADQIDTGLRERAVVEPIHQRDVNRDVFIAECELQLLRHELCGAGHGADENVKLDRQGECCRCGVVHYTTFVGTMMLCRLSGRKVLDAPPSELEAQPGLRAQYLGV